VGIVIEKLKTNLHLDIHVLHIMGTNWGVLCILCVSIAQFGKWLKVLLTQYAGIAYFGTLQLMLFATICGYC
jgi:hypothetical protein